MKVERKVLKSISELSMFKYVLVSYLIFFILFVIIFAVAALLGWALLATSGLTVQDLIVGLIGSFLPMDIISSFIPGINIAEMVGGLSGGLGGGILGIVLFIIVGLVASVFAAAMAAFSTWILNVILRIVGGIELRFAPGKDISTGKSPLEEKYEQNMFESKLNNR
jgi:hypothetical protein